MYNKSYDDIEFTKSEALKFIKKSKLNTLPSYVVMRYKGYRDLAYAIERKHGGIVKFRELINTSQLRVRKGSWKNLEFRIAMAKVAITIAKTETLPCKSKLDEIGFSSLSYAISKYDEGFHNFRKSLNEEDREERIRKYDDIHYGLDVAKQIKQKYGFSVLPNDKRLRRLGYSTLAYCIYKKYGGRKKFKQMLGEPDDRREIGLLKNIDYIIGEVTRIMNAHGLSRFPGKKQLSKLDSSLAYAIVKNFGYSAFREIFESLSS